MIPFAVTGPSASSRGKRLISSSKTYLVHQQRFIEIECITIDSDLDEVMEIMPPSNATTLSLHLASDSDGAPTEELRLNLANVSDSELTIEESPRKDESTRSSIDWDLDDTIEEPPRNAQTAGNRNDSDLDTTMEETELSTHNLTATADNWIDEEAMEVVRSPRDPGIPKQLRMDCRVNLGERVPSVSPVYLPQVQKNRFFFIHFVFIHFFFPFYSRSIDTFHALQIFLVLRTALKVRHF